MIRHDEIKFSLTYKFIIFVTGLLIATFVCVAYVVVNHEQEIITNKMQNSGLLLAKTLANVSKGPLFQSNYTELKGYMEDLRKDAEVAYAYIFEDQTKTCVVHINKNGKESLEGSAVAKFTDEVSLKVLGSKDETIQIWKDPSGARYLDISCPIAEGNSFYGKIRIGYSLKKLEEELKTTATKVIMISLIAILLGFMVAVILARIILKPVAELVNGVDKISFGDFGHQIKVKTSDELGLLAETFNRMSYNISVLYNVSSKMNYVSDKDELLNIILDSAIDALKAVKGSIMLLNENNELELSLVRGHTYEMKTLVKLKLGEGVAGTVAETGQSFIINKGEQDEMFKKYAEFIERSHIESLLCVPLKVDDRVIGVVNIVNKKEDGQKFNMNDTKLMMVLGAQAAVTISKARVYEESITDGMTKLFIHRYFQARLDDEMKRSARYGTKLALILFDVDHFKRFNDTYGHQQGDIVLIESAKIVKDSVRLNIDVPCRYGGEEFAIVMPETDGPGARIVAERLRKRIEAYEYPGQATPLHVTISLGISVFPDDATEKAMLIKKADDALYRAKECGRNNSQVYGEIPPAELTGEKKKSGH